MRASPSLLALLLGCAPALAAPPAAAPSAETLRARDAVAQALRSSDDPLQQERAVCRLAWPLEGERDAAVAAEARRTLETFGARYMYALQEALNVSPVEYSAEIVRTLTIQQQQGRPSEMPELVPTLIDALWVGNREAREQSIRALIAFRPALAVQPMIDSAIEYPALTPLVVQMLGTYRYEQARFWLEKMMIEGPQELRAPAAASLAQIGGAALGPLKNGLKAPDRDTRVLAARALLAAATEYELGAIYEYLERHADDDAALTHSLKVTAEKFEQQIAARDAAEAASAPKDF
ncbi:MAG TPA: hypothetical protein VMT33_05535 [Candidatus Bathyarchaeia archaeon]|nr:hypothetical protein [Candidatus Bathyarchaeia archaeon]